MSNSCKDGASKSNDDGVCDVNNMLQNMNTDDNNNASVCANCGKEGSSDEINNTCNKCKMVKYCNAACKKKHRHKHKKECEEYVRLAAKRAAELHDEELFKPPPPAEDCQICFLRLPHLMQTGSKYQSCCGKVICSGCIHAPVYDNQGNEVDNEKCPFCRIPTPYTNEEAIERLKKKIKAGDARAFYILGCFYSDELLGFPKDHTKALKLFLRAGELGFANAHYHIGDAYMIGKGVENDKKKATYYYELGALRGCQLSRFNLGINEALAGNFKRAIKHYLIAVEGGNSASLNVIKKLYTLGHASKEDYTKALQSYQTYLGEIKSSQRDEAAAAHECYRYY